MACSCSWTAALFIGLISGVFSQANKKALLATARYDRTLHAFHGEPSTFTLDRVVSDDTQMDFSPYSRVISIATNTVGKSLVVMDAATNTIYNYGNFSLFLNNTDKPDIVHRGVSYTYAQVAYDFLAGNVYWTDGYFKWIGMHPLKFEKDTSVYKIVKKNLNKPEGLALDPYDRYMFWSDVIGSRSVIGRSDLAGNSAVNIVDSKDANPIWITSLAVDIANKKIYWSDMSRHTIEYANYDGTMKGHLVKSLLFQHLSIAVADTVVCASEYYYAELVCYDKATKNETWFSNLGLFDIPWAVALYDRDQQTTAAHPCQQKTCKQMCINTGPNTATCACKEGYKLMGDGVSCESEHGFLFGKAVMIANETNACMLDIQISANHKQDPDCILTNLTSLKFFAVDSHQRQFYYVDSSSMSRILGVDMLSDTQSFSFDVNEDITGFSFDWVTRNLYWSESGGSISKYLIGSNGGSSKVIENEKSPAYVTVDPHLRKMYWLTGSYYDSTLVERKLDDANSRKVLIAEYYMYNPVALFYDVTSERLFLNDDAYLASVKPDNPVINYHTYIGDTKSIAVYKDYSYWASDEYLDMASLHSSYYDYDMDVTFMNKIVAVGVYDVDIQPAVKNNCTYSKGGCEHFCEPTGLTTFVCSCQFGFQLQPDGKSCSSVPFTDNFALLPDINHHQIYQVSLASGEARVLDIPDVDVPVSVIYDVPTQKIYWTNAIELEIRSSGLRSDTSEILLNPATTLPVGLAFDYSSNLLYFTSESWRDPSFIGCFDPQYNMYMTLVRDLDLPKNVALHPQMGWMVWTDISTKTSTHSYIGFAHMDGSNKSEIVKDDIVSPNGIVIDYSTKRIYWADAGRSSIESVLFDGSGRRQVLVEPDAGLVGLDISPPYLYYVGRNKQHISKYGLYTNRTVSFMNDIHAFGRTDTVRVYPEQQQPRSDHCYDNKGGCEFFCLSTPSGRTCGCPDGDFLNEDGKDCKLHITCTRKVPNAELDRKCMGHADGICDFKCANGYKKTVDTLTCDQNGQWSPSMYTACESLSGTCPASFQHGHVSNNCDKTVGQTCTYECNVGYIKNQANLQIRCLTSGAWNKPTESLCKPANVYCTNDIVSGKLEPSCTRGSGTECDYTCNTGYVKNKSVRKIVCLSDGKWNFHGPLCVLAPKGKCTSTLLNGKFSTGCLFRPKDACAYSCNSGYLKNTIVDKITCMESGQWNYAVDKLCMKAMGSCSKNLKNGQFISGCSATSGAKCDYMCNANFVQQPIALHVICYDGTWSSDPNQLCIEKSKLKPTISLANTQAADEGASGGTVALVVIIAIVLTVVVVLGLVYVFWWKKRKPQGQYVQNNTNLKFQRFDDSGVPSDGGVTGFSNPIHSQPDYGRFGTLREEGYITTEIAPGYDNVDPKDVNVSVNKSPSNNHTYDNTDA